MERVTYRKGDLTRVAHTPEEFVRLEHAGWQRDPELTYVPAPEPAAAPVEPPVGVPDTGPLLRPDVEQDTGSDAGADAVPDTEEPAAPSPARRRGKKPA